eukprot:m.25123 g.25123  ORF g.25123 m.25123 type:complete len:75 (+) comp14884_c0_seq1:264-488(+)
MDNSNMEVDGSGSNLSGVQNAKPTHSASYYSSMGNIMSMITELSSRAKVLEPYKPELDDTSSKRKSDEDEHEKR